MDSWDLNALRELFKSQKKSALSKFLKAQEKALNEFSDEQEKALNEFSDEQEKDRRIKVERLNSIDQTFQIISYQLSS
jgi:hypothetical protein